MFSIFPKNTEFGPKYAEAVSYTSEICETFANICENYQSIEQMRSKASTAEDNADNIMKDIIINLNDSFITPYDREDMYTLIDKIDTIGDEITRLLGHIDMYKVGDISVYLSDFSQIYLDEVKILADLIREIFAKKVNQDTVQNLLIEMWKCSARGNESYEKNIEKLFSEETNAINALKWEKIISEAQHVVYAFKKAGRTIEGIIMKVG